MGPGSASALHVNYGLRDEADGDQALCEELCARLGVALDVRRAGPPRGNVQAWAREVRYAEAARLGEVVAAGHTITDQAETVLYRLAVSPGSRRVALNGRFRARRPVARAEGRRENPVQTGERAELGRLLRRDHAARQP